MNTHNNSPVSLFLIFSFLISLVFPAYPESLSVEILQPVMPVVSGIKHSPVEGLQFVSKGKNKDSLKGLVVDLTGTTDLGDIETISLVEGLNPVNLSGKVPVIEMPIAGKNRVKLNFKFPLVSDTTNLWICLNLKDSVDLSHKIALSCKEAQSSRGKINLPKKTPVVRRIGKALHVKGEEGIVSCRIPGLATAADGTLLAIFDARYDSSRDLQGNIDIALKRSCDGGNTWTPVQKVLDMGEWGGLPEKYNGVSDACIISDKNSGRIYVAGLWMHGALDDNGKWIESLNEDSNYWIHQWKKKGSQPGIGIKETCQFLIAHSDDNGKTWSFPKNITADTKRPEWWLYAPAPGQGITMKDGTLVFPSQGRDSEGKPFSNITYSKDGGKSWTTSNPAYSDCTECNAVELSDGTVMLNMRDNRNRGKRSPNGRRVCITADLGESWTEHLTSRKVLTEPTCMASLYRHEYGSKEGVRGNMLLFVNPDNFKIRDNMTLKASFDDGKTWPKDNWILLDQTRGKGYSSIAAVDEDNIGILYESGLADLIFLKININEILNTL